MPRLVFEEIHRIPLLLLMFYWRHHDAATNLDGRETELARTHLRVGLILLMDVLMHEDVGHRRFINCRGETGLRNYCTVRLELDLILAAGKTAPEGTVRARPSHQQHGNTRKHDHDAVQEASAELDGRRTCKKSRVPCRR